MQYTKLGFNRLFKGYGSHQALCSLIVNRSVIPNFAYCRRYWQCEGFANRQIDSTNRQTSGAGGIKRYCKN
jgi:hypothetical protein